MIEISRIWGILIRNFMIILKIRDNGNIVNNKCLD